ncbi:MAG: glycosyltransferase family 4 protein [Candidatus Kerfeldbacteria bacterium]|nr:glycosyltransferase family 4 protein [Candidatus Kerfeldbacteria bacterium]
MIIGIDASRATVREKTGTEWYSQYIIEHLVLRHPEVTFWLYSKEPLGPPLSGLLGPRVVNKVLQWPAALLWSQLRLSLEMLWRRPDVLFVPAHTIPLIHPRATVTTCHDAGFEAFPELYGQTPIGPRRGWQRTLVSLLVRLVTLGRYGNSELDYHRFSMRLALRRAARVITVSRFSRDEFVRSYGADPNRFTIIPHGATPTSAGERHAGKSAPARSGLTRPYILSIGRLERKKNVAGALSTYGLLQRRLRDAPDFVLVGKAGVGFDEIQRALNAVPHPERVHQLSWVPADDLESLWRDARAFFFPSFYEGFGMPVLDAFRHGVPVVASNIGALREVSGDAALLADPNDHQQLAEHLYRVLTDDALRHQLRERGTRQAAHFPDWDTVADQTFRVLTRAAG